LPARLIISDRLPYFTLSSVFVFAEEASAGWGNFGERGGKRLWDAGDKDAKIKFFGKFQKLGLNSDFGAKTVF
jgi:hypothetical protein